MQIDLIVIIENVPNTIIRPCKNANNNPNYENINFWILEK